MTTTTNQPNSEASQAAKARRLAFLLTQSVMPQEQKEAWMHLLPIMDDAQVDSLLSILEREHDGYRVTSQEFLQDLQRLETELKSEVTKLEQAEQAEIEAYVTKAIAEQPDAQA